MAMITLEAIKKLQGLYEDKFGEAISEKQALFIAGFKIGKSTPKQFHLQYRMQNMPSKIANGLVFRGYVRKMVQCVEPSGEIIYGREDHPLKSLYDKFEIVTGDIISKELVDILSIGSYNSTE